MEERILETENIPTQKANRTKLAIIFVVALFISLFVALVVFLNNETQNPKLEVSQTTLSVEYNEYLGYSATVKGMAKNVSNRDFSYVSIEFSIYDSSGNNLGTALANINNLSKGDSWQFEAHLFSFPSSMPVSYRLVEITTW